MKYALILLLFFTFRIATAQFNWVKSPNNLILTPSPNLYEGTAIGSPSILDEGDTLKMLYATGGTDIKGRIGYAYSLDGTNWTKYNNAHPFLMSVHQENGTVIF